MAERLVLLIYRKQAKDVWLIRKRPSWNRTLTRCLMWYNTLSYSVDLALRALQVFHPLSDVL